jgi:hypothetical protein
MTKNPRIRRILIALAISIALNGILLVFDSFGDPRNPSSSLVSRIVGIMFSLPGAFAEWLVPPGHDAEHILGGIAVSIASSLIFYGFVAWAVLAIWARAHRESSGESGPLSILK